MPTVLEIIHRLLPDGSNRADPGFLGTWDECPHWPPDLFAVAATLVDRTGCYAHPRVIGIWGEPLFDEKYLIEVQRLGRAWKKRFQDDPGSGDDPGALQNYWRRLLEQGDDLVALQNDWRRLLELSAVPIREVNPDDYAAYQEWWGIAIRLMAIADEASAGIGFVLDDGEDGDGSDPVATTYLNFVYRHQSARKDATRGSDTPNDDDTLPYLMSSICRMVPSTELCVQPKTRTPQIGCTLRSMSHNLALLPSIGEVITHWFQGNLQTDPKPAPLNLLIVPFPYLVDGLCFHAAEATLGSEYGPWHDRAGNKSKFFEVHQRWLHFGKDGRLIEPEEMADFLGTLIREARHEVNEVDGIVLPELALSDDMARKVAHRLAEEFEIEFFISGVLAPPITQSSGESRGPRNAVYVGIFAEGAPASEWLQSKHHRWMLDRYQITRYHLGDLLNPEARWWEKIDISPRECRFGVFRHRACLTAIVCEDLARIDPVQTVIRSVGPNLLVALLMDGPQLEQRWSGRYATVLADDPGSAVLSLTSLGMVRRSIMPGKEELREIALWKQPGGEAQPLKLPAGAHALLLTLSHVQETNFTLDGRSDRLKQSERGGTIGLSLTGVRQIIHPPGSLPDWAKPDPIRSPNELILTQMAEAGWIARPKPKEAAV